MTMLFFARRKNGIMADDNRVRGFGAGFGVV